MALGADLTPACKKTKLPLLEERGEGRGGEAAADCHWLRAGMCGYAWDCVRPDLQLSSTEDLLLINQWEFSTPQQASHSLSQSSPPTTKSRKQREKKGVFFFWLFRLQKRRSRNVGQSAKKRQISSQSERAFLKLDENSSLSEPLAGAD